MTSESLQADDMRMDLASLFGAIWSRWLRIVLVTVLALAATYLVLMFVPKTYESMASLLVEPRINAYTRPGGSIEAVIPTADETLISSQIELVKSRDTLLQVINAEKLREVPELAAGGGSPIGFITGLFGGESDPGDLDEVVIGNLAARLTVIRERDSRIVGVYVRTEDPSLSARIANALAKAHVSRRAGLTLSDTAEASVWLEQQIGELRVRVAEAEGKVASFRIDNDLFSGANNTSLLDQQLSNIATQITSAQERKNTAQSKADLINGLLEQGQPIEGVPDVQQSVVIQQLSQQKAQFQGERAQKMATLLGNHPNVRALTAQIGEIDSQIKIEGRQVAAALEAQAKIEADLEASLQADLDRMKSGVSTATRETVQLNELEREAKAQRDLLESYLIRYRDAMSRTDVNSAMPDVRVVAEAAPSTEPAAPKTSLILVAVAIVTLAVQIGSILFGELLSGRALVARDERYVPAEPRVAFAPPPAPTPVYVAPEPSPVAAHQPDPVHDFAEEQDEPVEEPSAQYAYLPEIDDYTRPVAPIRNPAIEHLSDAIALGEARIVILAGLRDVDEPMRLAEDLVARALNAGLSVVRVDAGSGRTSTEPGLSDLAAERASFGDVVHKTSVEGLAEVPWGHLTALDRRSIRPFTLVEALADIYEVVLVTTGRFGIASALHLFSGMECQLVLTGDEAGSANAVADAQALGFAHTRVIPVPVLDAEVA